MKRFKSFVPLLLAGSFLFIFYGGEERYALAIGLKHKNDCSREISVVLPQGKQKITLDEVNLEEQLLSVCKKTSVPAQNAKLTFHNGKFEYQAEKKGLACDYQALLSDATLALSGKKDRVTLKTFEYAPSVTVEKLKRRTQMLSTFSTRYSEENQPRSHNIALATKRIAGVEIPPHGVFSFNKRVGARTQANGFQVAAVIQEGEFRPGVGGGVCQASTTLFNAALLAGMQIAESHAHSLTVGYISPSLDAMVSSYSDLKFMNPYSTPVYIWGEANAGEVKFTFFGLPDGRKYQTQSVLKGYVLPPEPKQAKEGEHTRLEKKGVVSESYLLVYEGEKLIQRTRIRRDSYAAVQGVFAAPEQEEIEEESQKNPLS